jgi:glycosyltransferase involved in cell wall biosynthesis
MLAHGGAQIQLEQTKAALEELGVVVEPLRWWDDQQTGDILHYLGRIPLYILQAAQAKGMKVVMADLLTGQGSRSDHRLRIERIVRRLAMPLVPRGLAVHFDWDSYRLADACVALTPREAKLMKDMFRAPAERVHVVPNGVEEIFFQAPAVPRGPWLVCTATITDRKRVLELAQAAVQAETPLWIIGKPYSESDPYFLGFAELVRSHPRLLRFEGPIFDRSRLAQVYREARGFVLLSTKESLSLSALEASACECPLLLSDLPWATTFFGGNASYCPVPPARRTVESLKAFYKAAPGLKPPPKPLGWLDVASKLKEIYESLLGQPAPSTSR